MEKIVVCGVCLQGQLKEEEVDVPSDNRVYLGKTFQLWRCPLCRSINSLVPQSLSEDYSNYSFSAQGESYFNRVVNRKAFKTFLNTYRLRSKDLFLAFGLRNDVFLKYLNRKINHFFGFDPHIPKYADRQFIEKRRYDFIFMETTFSLFDDPRETLRYVTSLLNKGGLLCIGTPDADGIDLEHPERFVLELHQPYHRHLYTNETLCRLADEAGLDLVHSSHDLFSNTPWPFVNWRFMREYVQVRDNSVDALFEKSGRLKTVLSHPRLLFFGLFGWLMNPKTHMVLFFKKKVGIRCRLCGGSRLEFIYKNTYEEMDLVRCLDCQIVFLDLRNTPTSNFYKKMYYPTQPLLFEKIDGFTRFRDICRFVGTDAKVFEIGCGHGLILRRLDKEGYEVYGNEFSEDATDYAENKLFLKIYGGHVDKVPIERRDFDLVFLYHVFEHLDKPIETLEKIRALLKPGGKLLLEVPNAGSLYSKWFGRRWFHLDLPKHVFHFNKTAIRYALEKSGFEVLHFKTHYFLYDVFGCVQSTLNYLLKTQEVMNDKEVHLTFAPLDILRRLRVYVEWGMSMCLMPFLFVCYSVVYFVFRLFQIEGGTLTVYARKKEIPPAGRPVP